jgi:hypothetical protein
MILGVLKINVIFISLLFVGGLLYLIRKKEMKEGYIIFWFFISVGILLLMVSEKFLYALVSLVGAATPSVAILFFALVTLFYLNVHYSIKISKLEKVTIQLIQNMGIMENMLLAQIKDAKKKP